MKGLFLFQRRFAVIGHAIALNLKEKYDIDEFCGYVYLRSSKEYLENQNDIKYTKLLLDDDVHNEYEKERLDLEYLKNLEKELGLPNLWPYLTIDRVLMYSQLVREYPYNFPLVSHEKMLRILQITAKRITKLLEEEKPDFVFMSVVGAVGSKLLYEMAKKRGIPVLNGIFGRVSDLYLLSENFYDFSWADKEFTKIKNGEKQPAKIVEAKKWLENFRAKPFAYYSDLTPSSQAVSRKKQLSFLHPKNALRSMSWFFQITKNYYANRDHNDYEQINPWHYLIDHLKRKARNAIGYNSLYDKPVVGEDYAFYPLHYEPEIATMLYAPHFTDQSWVIQQYARSLPAHFKLYVKEHPSMAGFRPRSFYKELKKIPNVKIIDPNTVSFALINKAKIVTTITSTVGWEAILLKKPVVTFGKVFYNILSGAKQCITPEELPNIVKEQLENHKQNDEELIQYLAAMMEDGVETPLITLWEKEIDNFDKIKEKTVVVAELIDKKMKLLKSEANNNNDLTYHSRP